VAEGDLVGRALHVLVFAADPDAPGARRRIARAVEGRPAALGPTVELADAARSADRARRALQLVEAGALPGGDLVIADAHHAALLLHGDPGLAAQLAAERLAPRAELRGTARERLRATLRAWLDRQGRIDETARVLDVHPQTVRYRLGQLREAFGDALDDPETRFELELALRVQAGEAGEA
jgi:DNA-binding PucR family transcriptional regulator